MEKVFKLNSSNIENIKSLYNEFSQKAFDDYKFELPPLTFDDFKLNLCENILKGYYIESEGVPKGFLLYMDSLNQGIELNIIHETDNNSQNKKKLTEQLLEDLKQDKKDALISYPMLGIQGNFVQDVAYLEFELTGQAVVEFDFTNPVCLQILNKSKTPELPQDYTLTTWKNEYIDKTSEIIHETFKNMPDAEFDPRYKSFEGSKDIVLNIVENIYGDFLPEISTVLKYKDEPVGICFANLTTPYKANIPIVGVLKPHNKKGMGKLILKNTVTKLFEFIKSGNTQAKSINATADTDNYPALRMYRKIGFKEIYNYPHAYLKL